MMIATWRGSLVGSNNIRERFPVPQPRRFVDAMRAVVWRGTLEGPPGAICSPPGDRLTFLACGGWDEERRRCGVVPAPDGGHVRERQARPLGGEDRRDAAGGVDRRAGGRVPAQAHGPPPERARG